MPESTSKLLTDETPARRALPEGEFRAVVYKVAGLLFATDVRQVQEIIRPSRVARLAALPNYVEGVIKRHGRIVPIVDLRKRLGLTTAAPTPDTCAIIVRLPVAQVGFVVDAALELRRFRPAALEAPAAVLAQVDQVYIQAVAKSGNDVLVMLDLQLLLTPGEQTELAGMIHV